MFDLAWSEIALIGVVALVVIGPKDLPEAIRGVAKGVQKLRRMASEFQTHADELVREAKLDEVRNQIHEVKSAVDEIRNFDLRGTIEKNVDADGAIRSTFESDPLKPATDWTPPAAESVAGATDGGFDPLPGAIEGALGAVPADPAGVSDPFATMMEGARAGMPEAAPAFVPPTEAARVLPAASAPTPVLPAAKGPTPAPPAPPAFVPPATPQAAPIPAPATEKA